jgi:hypothetical protein
MGARAHGRLRTADGASRCEVVVQRVRTRIEDHVIHLNAAPGLGVRVAGDRDDRGPSWESQVCAFGWRRHPTDECFREVHRSNACRLHVEIDLPSCRTALSRSWEPVLRSGRSIRATGSAYRRPGDERLMRRLATDRARGQPCPLVNVRASTLPGVHCGLASAAGVRGAALPAKRATRDVRAGTLALHMALLLCDAASDLPQLRGGELRALPATAPVPAPAGRDQRPPAAKARPGPGRLVPRRRRRSRTRIRSSVDGSDPSPLGPRVPAAPRGGIGAVGVIRLLSARPAVDHDTDRRDPP